MFFPATALEASSPSLFSQLWDYFRDTYFPDNNTVYENLNFGAGSVTTLRSVIFGILVGFIIASFAVVIDKKLLGNFVRKLLSGGNVGAANAVTLADAGYSRNYAIKHAVRKSINLRRVVKCREEEEFNAEINLSEVEYERKRAENPVLPKFKRTEYHVNADTDSFYIPEELKYTADVKFDKKGTTWGAFAAVIIVSVILFSVLLFFIPEILQMLDNFVGNVSASSSGKILS